MDQITEALDIKTRINDKGKWIRITDTNEEVDWNYNYLNLLETMPLKPRIEPIPIICNSKKLSYI